MGLHSGYITRVTPFQVELMERLLNNETLTSIAEEKGMEISHLSKIINSPLFKLEFRKRELRREQKFLDLEDRIVESALKGVEFHADVIDNPKLIYPTEMKFKSASLMAHLGARLLERKKSLEISPPNGDGPFDEEGDGTYEERLQKVTIEQRTKKRLPPSIAKMDSIIEPNYPPEGDLISEEEGFQEKIDLEIKSQLANDRLDQSP